MSPQPTGGDDWYEFNDVNVKKLDPADVQQAFDLAKAAEEGKVQAPGTSSPAGNGDEKPGTAKPDVSAPADASAGAGAASGAEKGKDAKDTEAAAEDEVAPMSNVALNMCTNAYLIMYRVVGEGDADVELPSFLKAMVSLALCRLHRTAHTLHAFPDQWREHSVREDAPCVQNSAGHCGAGCIRCQQRQGVDRRPNSTNVDRGHGHCVRRPVQR